MNADIAETGEFPPGTELRPSTDQLFLRQRVAAPCQNSPPDVRGDRGETSGRVNLVLLYANGGRDDVKIDARWNGDKKRWESQEEANLIFSNIERLTRRRVECALQGR